MSVEEGTDLEVLNQEEPKVEVKEKKEEVVEEKEEVSIEEEVEEEKEEKIEEENDEDEVKLQTRPTIKQIIEKYPGLFKDFPDIKHAIFREQKFTEIYPTVEDAAEARDKSDNFDEMSELILSGKQEDLGKFFSILEDGNKGATSLFASNILPILYKADQKAYFEAINPILENVVKSFYREGDENQRNAALILSKWLLGDMEIASTNKTGIKVKSNEGREEIDKERNSLRMQRYTEVKKSVDERCIKIMSKSVNDGLDPTNILNEGLKEILSEKIQKEVDRVLSLDETHMRNMNSLWKRAFNAGFVGDWEARIRTAYLARAKSVMPAIRARIRASATNQKLNESKKKIDTASLDSNRTEIQTSGKVSQQNGKVQVLSPRKIDWNQSSDSDILNDRAVLKK